MSFLPQEIRPITTDQQRLTDKHLKPALADIEFLLYRIRRDIDKELQPQFPEQNGKAYPYGRCLEISDLFMAKLRVKLNSKEPHRGLRALRAFLAGGGRIDWVWGALRETYFQNAFQVGAWYVDVSNDTVTVTKPAVEILPWKDANFIAIQGIDHFAKIAKNYWGAETYVNDLVPALAPIFPMILHFPSGQIEISSPTNYMVDYFRRDRFVQSEDFLARGPSLPQAVWQGVWQALSEEDRAANTDAGRHQAIAACRTDRDAACFDDASWRLLQLQAHTRIHYLVTNLRIA